MLVKDALLEALARPGTEDRLEVHDGQLREKPSMTFAHGSASFYLGLQLGNQLDRTEYVVRVNHGRLRRTEKTYYIPDVYVIPMAIITPERAESRELEIYDEPLPFVAEFWSPSTGDYDVVSKLPEYKRRGDAEIWLVHPFELTVTAWRRQPDSDYTETVYRDGQVQLWALPGVTIDLDALSR
jgi:Uma2 family endonuclease